MADLSDDVRAADEDLRRAMTGYQAGDGGAFEQVYATLAPVLKRYLLSQARDPSRADDLVQETFLQIHRARHTYDPAYPVTPWVLAIARHVFLMDRRYRTRRHEFSQQPLEEHVTEPVVAHDQSVIARAGLKRALGALSATTRQALVLHHLCGHSFNDIAKKLNVGSPALRCRTSRAIARLRETLK